MNNVDSKEALYETYFKAKSVDLGEAAIPIFMKNPSIYPLYPKTAGEFLQELSIKNEKRSGMRVWKMHKAKDFEGIKARTTTEVNDAIAIANGIVRRSKS